MILIAHRGNTHGPSDLENDPELIIKTLLLGFDVEIDVWLLNNNWWLGHDTPQYRVSTDFLQQGGIWCHAKNIDALVGLRMLNVRRYFWHEADKYTLTSTGHIWTYPGQQLTIRSIENILTSSAPTHSYVYGVCSDYVGTFVK